MIDLDYSTQVDDAHGHAVSDLALQKVAQAIQGEVRDSDFAARLGGHEFVIVLDGTDQGAALEIAQRFGILLREFTQADDQIPVMSLSIGIAPQKGKSTESLDQLARVADRTRCAVNVSGRNRIVADEVGEAGFDTCASPAIG